MPISIDDVAVGDAKAMKFRPQSPSLNAASRPQRTPQNQAPQNDSTANDSTALELTIDNAMRVDQYRLKRAQQRLSVDEYEAQLKKSVNLHAKRIAAQPCIEYSDELPISQHRDELIELIRSRQVIVVCGETGSGKSTQLPKILLESGLGRKAMIGHTQPRRLAARSIATRLAEELQTPLGELVGYQVRFGDQTSERSLVKSMTDGILLAETQSDHFLDAYDAIIIDEAHERSLNIDFLLGFLRRLQGKRSDLKIVITSATIDADRDVNATFAVDGSAQTVDISGSSSVNLDMEGTSINYKGNSRYIDGVFQEIIFWTSSQEAAGNLSAIETNINDHFDIYT